MLQVSSRQSLPLTQPIEGEASVQWLDRGIPVPREVIGSIMHDGAIVIGHSLGGDGELAF